MSSHADTRSWTSLTLTPTPATTSEQPLAIRARAPLRVSFIGGGTDIPAFYNEHGGAVLLATVNRYVHVTLRPRQDDLIQIRSLDFDQVVKYHVEQEVYYDGVLDLAKAVVRRIRPQNNFHGLDLYIESDAPAGSGLGGSAALTVALSGALKEFAGLSLEGYQMADLAYQVEREDLNISGGKQDQYASTFGGFNLIEFSRERVVVIPLRIPTPILNDLERFLMLCYTGRTRLSAGLIDRQMRLYAGRHMETVDAMKALTRLTYEMRDALFTGRLRDFAQMLHQGWVYKVQANPEITDPTIDEMYEEARRHGALGGKLLGAGSGGYFLLFCEADRKRAVRERLEKMGGQCTDFTFVHEGLQAWRSTCV
ncbi:MAG: GHMP kinase [Dehalococcoidia bacterium]